MVGGKTSVVHKVEPLLLKHSFRLSQEELADTRCGKGGIVVAAHLVGIDSAGGADSIHHAGQHVHFLFQLLPQLVHCCVVILAGIEQHLLRLGPEKTPSKP